MFVLLRHPHDEDPDATYALDPHLTKKGYRSMHDKIDLMIKEYGIPSIIYCSPMTRCREATKYMCKYINHQYHKDVKMIVEPKISRYFTSKERKNLDIVRDKTRDFETPIGESYHDFKERVISFARGQKVNIKQKKNVWCVTHYLVVRRFSKLYGFPIPKRMPYMWNIGLY